MKEIKAVIQPARLARVRDAFRRLRDFPGMTVTRAEGQGYHPDKPDPPGIKTELTDSSARVRLEIVCSDDRVEEIVRIIREICHTGRPGDGVLWVSDVERFLRMRE